MIRVMIESPYAGDETYLAECIAHSLARGEAPFASHGFYTRYLDIQDSEQRTIGLACRDAWAAQADVIRFYMDRGCSSGMWQAYLAALAAEQPIEIARIIGLGQLYQDHRTDRSRRGVAELTKRLLTHVQAPTTGHDLNFDCGVPVTI